jgi:glucokinase
VTLACGIDVGGTKIAGGVVDDDGKVLAHATVESPAEQVEAIEEAIVGLVTELRAEHPIEAVGVGAAGYVDSSRSTVLFAPNLAWRQVDLRAELEPRLDLPVVIENDANAAAWGEFTYGAGHDVDDLLLVTVGTGIGGGLVLDGELYRGAFGVGGEIGHLRVVRDGQLCGCGKHGCLEQYASGSALVRNTRAAASGGGHAADALVERAGGDPHAIDGPMITAAARAGDPFAVEQLVSLGRWLGEGIAALATILDPAAVAVGGGVGEAGDLILEPLRVSFARHLSGLPYRPLAEVRRATLGNQAGLIGAADLARR